MRMDDMEKVFDQGWTKCGTYFYLRSAHKSCCEVFQYRVDCTDFKISPQQKKVIRRFHNYLNYGSKSGPEPKIANENAAMQIMEAQGVLETEEVLAGVKKVVEEVVRSEYVAKMEDKEYV